MATAYEINEMLRREASKRPIQAGDNPTLVKMKEQFHKVSGVAGNLYTSILSLNKEGLTKVKTELYYLEDKDLSKAFEKGFKKEAKDRKKRLKVQIKNTKLKKLLKETKIASVNGEYFGKKYGGYAIDHLKNLVTAIEDELDYVKTDVRGHKKFEPNGITPTTAEYKKFLENCGKITNNSKAEKEKEKILELCKKIEEIEISILKYKHADEIIKGEHLSDNFDKTKDILGKKLESLKNIKSELEEKLKKTDITELNNVKKENDILKSIKDREHAETRYKNACKTLLELGKSFDKLAERDNVKREMEIIASKFNFDASLMKSLEGTAKIEIEQRKHEEEIDKELKHEIVKENAEKRAELGSSALSGETARLLKRAKAPQKKSAENSNENPTFGRL